MSSGQNILNGIFGAKAKRGSWQPSPAGGRLPGVLLVVGLLVLWGAFSAFYTVQPEQRAVVKRFGAVVAITDPGLHFKLPFGIDKMQLVATERVLKEEFGFRTVGESQPTRYADTELPDESLMLSGDLNMVDAEWVVQYRIADPVKFLYAMREPVRTLRDISESVMRRAVGNRLGSDVLTTARTEIAELVELEIQQAMERYDNGIRVVTVQLQDVVPPKAVRPAFNEVNEARQERERMINEATKQANQRVPLARGQANRVIAEAEGYATERVNNALGETARFRSILAEYRSAPQVTRTRMYLETLNQVLPDVGQVLVVQKGQVSPLPLLNLRDAKSTTAEAK
jgi:membrane protease subunit HflK